MTIPAYHRSTRYNKLKTRALEIFERHGNWLSPPEWQHWQASISFGLPTPSCCDCIASDCWIGVVTKRACFIVFL
jgi:hypothetical protein